MKSEIRRYFKNFKKRLSQETKKTYDQSIYENIIRSDLYKNAQTIFVYLSMNDEIDTRKFINKALEDGKKIYVPKIRKKMIMDAVLLESLNDIILRDFSIETTKNEEVLESPNLSLVPGLCFDDNKYRIGFGGGYYDYYIANHKSTYIGLFYSQCKIDEIPVESFDQRLDYIVTEKELF